ncbi:uncharacterized protein J3R85_010132 [Psidium guajava]|nr:uncharacterized protein J3R85_010132 [Psidium guajava]
MELAQSDPHLLPHEPRGSSLISVLSLSFRQTRRGRRGIDHIVETRGHVSLVPRKAAAIKPALRRKLVGIKSVEECSLDVAVRGRLGAGNGSCVSSAFADEEGAVQQYKHDEIGAITEVVVD